MKTLSGWNAAHGLWKPEILQRRMDAICTSVASAPAGQANDRLFHAALQMGSIIATDALDRESAERLLLDAAKQRGIPAAETKATIRSGLEYGEANGVNFGDRSPLRERPFQTGDQKGTAPISTNKTVLAKRIWSQGKPIGGTPAESYMRGRGLLPPFPLNLQFHPSVPMPNARQRFPALIARIVEPLSERLLGIQRTALLPDGSGKASIATPRASLGATSGGVVVFGDLAAGQAILEGEGIETVLSASLSSGLPAIATLSAGTLGRALLPKGRPVTILGEIGSEAAARLAAQRRHGNGHPVRIAWPDATAGKDMNDVLQILGQKAVSTAIDEAQPWEEKTGTRIYSARCVAAIPAQAVRWIWHNRIARGKLALIAGEPGRGKSQLTLFLAAVASRGGDFPDGAKCEPGHVILISCEDDIADTIRPRLEALDADLSMISVLEGISGRETGTVEAFDIAKGTASLAQMMSDLGNVALVIIDPISAYLGRVNSHNNAEVRNSLLPLQRLAVETGAAILMVSHLNKATDLSALARVSGSGAFGAVARSAWLVERDPADGDSEKRILAPIKNNIGDDRTGFCFEIETAEVSDGIQTSRVRFLPGTVRMSADDLLASCRGTEQRGTKSEQAADFLRDALDRGPIPVEELKEMAKTRGIGWRTIEAAKPGLSIESQKHRDGWIWSMPDAETGDLFKTARPQRRRCRTRSNTAIGTCNPVYRHPSRPQHTLALRPCGLVPAREDPMTKKLPSKSRTLARGKRSGASALNLKRSQTAAEIETVMNAIDRNKKRGTQINIHVSTDSDGNVIDMNGGHNDNFAWLEHLQDVFGTGDRRFAIVELNRLIAASRLKGGALDSARLNALVSVIDGVRPNNEIEAMLAAQMAVTHSLAMELIRRAQQAENVPQFDSANNGAARLFRTYAIQAETQRRLRHGGSQTVRVEHVHVHAGGQAIVGNVAAGARAPGEGDERKRNQPHAPD